VLVLVVVVFVVLVVFVLVVFVVETLLVLAKWVLVIGPACTQTTPSNPDSLQMSSASVVRLATEQISSYDSLTKVTVQRHPGPRFARVLTATEHISDTDSDDGVERSSSSAHCLDEVIKRWPDDS
jgi:hypothetical protein